ncbi:hypothetical protein SAMN05660666_02299 [Novosphingobium aromaticivorans]|nr:hypothetical protein SAMN05660666_02299 [Novosphingobium aromaticivorans]
MLIYGAIARSNSCLKIYFIIRQAEEIIHHAFRNQPACKHFL